MSILTTFAGFTCDLDPVSLFLWRVFELAAPIAVIVGSIFVAKRYKSNVVRAIAVIVGLISAFVVFVALVMAQMGCKGFLEILIK